MPGSAKIEHNSEDLYNHLYEKEIDYYPLVFCNNDKWGSNPYSIDVDYNDDNNDNIIKIIEVLFKEMDQLKIDKSLMNFESLLESVYKGRILSISDKEAKALNDELADYIQSKLA